MALYRIVALGTPTANQIKELKKYLHETALRFRLRPEVDIELSINPITPFSPDSKCSAAAIFFGGKHSKNIEINLTIDASIIPILPVASRADNVGKEIPAALVRLNCVFYKEHGPERVFASLLECLGLLPRQRRVFLSYRRKDATPVAIQLFAELSARHYEVFLDTHKIGAGVDFQQSLWHNLCDVDVLIMLDTPEYFASRWTAAEYGRALAKGIGVLRVQWPDFDPSKITGTSSLVELVPEEFQEDGTLSIDAIERICGNLEDFRSLAHATRHQSIVSAVQDAIVKVQGKVDGVDANRAMQITLRSGRKLIVQPTLGVPTAVTLQTALDRAGTIDSAIVFDHLGIMPSWLQHMDWLKTKVKGARWVRMTDAAWDFAGWEA